MSRRTVWLAVGGLLLNALTWGLSWWPMRQLDASGLHPLWANTWMFCLASLLLWRSWAVLWRWLRAQPLLWLLMLASGLTNLGFNWAVTTGDVVRVVLLFYLMPAWALLLAWWLLAERPDRAALWRIVCSVAGMALVLHRPDAAWPLPSSLPDFLALGAGVAFALNNILLLRLRETPAQVRMVAMFGGSVLTSLLCAALLGGGTLLAASPWPQTMQWPWLLGLALAFLLSNYGLQYGAQHLSAHTTALVMMSEIVFASVSSLLLGAAHVGMQELLGGGMIVGTALSAVFAHHAPESAHGPTD